MSTTPVCITKFATHDNLVLIIPLPRPTQQSISDWKFFLIKPLRPPAFEIQLLHSIILQKRNNQKYQYILLLIGGDGVWKTNNLPSHYHSNRLFLAASRFRPRDQGPRGVVSSCLSRIWGFLVLGCVDSVGNSISEHLLVVVVFVFVFVHYCLFRKSHLFVLMSIYTKFFGGGGRRDGWNGYVHTGVKIK